MRVDGRSLVCFVTMLSLGLPFLCLPVQAQDEVIGFDSDRWVVRTGQTSEVLGRTAFDGLAFLEDVDLVDGVIEVDIAVTMSGVRAYPGIMFRMQSQQECERIYVRPHRAPLYPDALQYTPVFNGNAGWQLYSGDGFTTTAEIPVNEWIPLRVEFSGSQARVFLGDGERPALHIPELQRGAAGGAIGVNGSGQGVAYFSNFRYREDRELSFDPVPEPDKPAGAMTDWELSQSFRYTQLDLERSPWEQDLGQVEWRTVEGDPSGLVDIARTHPRTGREPDCVLARRVITSGSDRKLKLDFGYSDLASVFLNGELLFTGSSPYRGRDPSFLGIVGLNDRLPLPLREGENELLLIVVESFGGWGFICRDADATYLAEGVEEVAVAESFLTPESILHDPGKGLLYVSNFDAYNRAALEGGQFISTLSTDGALITRKWVGGLRNPTGMALVGNRLYVAERTGLCEIDTDTGEILERHRLEGARFPNDVAVDGEGRIYVSDSAGNKIYRSSGEGFTVWASGDDLAGPNGIRVRGEELIVGSNGDHCLRSLDLGTAEMATIMRFRTGILDGVETDGMRGHLISHWEGRLYRVEPPGVVVKLLDTASSEVQIADFEHVPELGLAFVPTFMDDRVVTYRLSP